MSRVRWLICLAAIIAVGILSRVVRTGFVLCDKYLGDGLYAAMVYAMLRLWWESRAATVGAAVVMTAIELFQLTLIPARMLNSGHLMVRVIGRLLGTQFSYLDLLTYFVAIGGMFLMDCLGEQATDSRRRPADGHRNP